MTTTLELTPENISQFVELAARIRRKEGHAEWAQFVNARKFVYPLTPPSDPHSPEYRDFQLQLWSAVSGRSEYKPSVSELNDNLDTVKRIGQFYPFVSGSSEETGNYMIAAAAILKKLGLPPGSKIVEYGVGWGHTTRLLASFGYNVTAIDIEQRFLDLLGPYSLPGTPPIRSYCASFEQIRFDDVSLDGAVFFECFHHCLAYGQLVANLKQHLKPGGKIIFCGEPFYDDWFDFPWGVRLDGQSVWAIRTSGWMELGFRKSFIIELLQRNGFSVEWSRVPEAGPYQEFLTAVSM